MRLFVAIPLPPVLRSELLRCQPAPAQGVRRIAAENFHITLHFIGDADVEAVKSALAGIQFAAFPLSVNGLGNFRRRSGAQVLWARVADHASLKILREEIGRRLLQLGLAIERGRYSPHISLARSKPGWNGLAAFLTQPPPKLTFLVEAFALYQSQLGPRGPRYTAIETYRCG